MAINNTDTLFYSTWTREQLVSELVRINKILNEIKEIKANGNF